MSGAFPSCRGWLSALFDGYGGLLTDFLARAEFFSAVFDSRPEMMYASFLVI